MTSEKNFVDLHKSGSSLGAISKRLKVPCESLQTVVRKFKHHGTMRSHHIAQEGDAFCILEMNVLCVNSANQSQNNSKGPCEDA